MKVTITQTRYESVELTDSQVQEVGMAWLGSLTKGRWVDGDKLKEEQAAPSHRYIATVGDKTHPDYSLVLAVTNLRKELSSRELY